MWNTLKEFVDWYIENKYPLRPPFDSGVYVTDFSNSFILYREGQYQVELYLIKPGTLPADHSHPNVENIIMVLGGTIEGSVNNQVHDVSHLWNKSNPDGTSILFGKLTEPLIYPSTHSVGGGPNGCAVMTFEKWPEGVKPTSVIYDWGGPPVGEFHRSALEDV
jgi:hypothetical protein